MSSVPGIQNEAVKQYKQSFLSDPKNRLARNVCSKQDLWDVCKNPDVIHTTPHVYNCKVSNEGKPMTNQKSSGRCWIFACLNVIRSKCMSQFKVENLEFSQNYLFFWDKVERANYNLQCYVQCARKGETADGRLVHHLLFNPAEDGGQWDMMINLIEKYGIVPKTCCPDAQSAEASVKFNRLINNKMREFCNCLQTMVKDGASEAKVQAEKTRMMEQIYRIASTCLGTPLETFTWEFYDLEKNYVKIGPIKPVDFYRQYIKPIYNMEDKVCIVNDPRPNHSYGKLYTVDYLGNMTGGRPVLYINQPIEVLKKVTIASLKDDEAVWFGCDVGKCFYRQAGLLDLDILDLDLVFGTNMLGMSKADRLIYGESLMTHAMTITAAQVEEGPEVKATRWRVENSWGDADGDKGYIAMSDNWFSEFVYEVVVDKKHLTSDIVDVLKQTPVVLPAWDPMGALA